MRVRWIVPAVVAVGLVASLVDQRSGLQSWVRLRGELRLAESRLEALVEETTALRAEIRALEESPFALERAIREDLLFARPGEVVVRFSRDPVSDAPETRLEHD